MPNPDLLRMGSADHLSIAAAPGGDTMMSSYKQLSVGFHISIWTTAGIWEVRVSSLSSPHYSPAAEPGSQV